MKSQGRGIDESSVKLEEVNCELCGRGNSEPFLNSNNIRLHCTKEYNLVKCKECGLVFLNPRPTKDSSFVYYRDSDTEKSHNKPAFYEKFYYSFFRSIPGRIKGKLLDIGCGSGRYIYVMREKGWDVKGVDMAFTDYGRNVLNLDICEGELPDCNFKENFFDAVTLWWVLEHLYKPLDTIKESFRILKKGGVLVIAVPNIASTEARFFKRDWFHLFVPKHIWFFSPATLKEILEKAGFKKIRIRHDLFSFGIIGSIQCFLNRMGLPVSLTNPICYILSLPIDMVSGMLKSSGLITVYAYKE